MKVVEVLRGLDNSVADKRFDANQMQSDLKDHFADLIPSVNICEKVELGRTGESMVEEAKKHATDLIVISTYGTTALAHIVKGSVTEKLIRNAPCPVLSIGPESVESMAEELLAA